MKVGERVNLTRDCQEGKDDGLSSDGQRYLL